MTEAEHQRKLSAIMFTDIVGYSKMMGADEAGTMAFLKFHNALIREEIAKYGGHVIKTVGDAFLADFNSAVNSVRCAVSVQKRFHQHNLETGKNQQVRIGIHIGDVVVSENDIFGDGVNIAARIQPIAEPGGICISQDVYNHIKNKVEFKVVSLGPRGLKNIAKKIEIYRIVTDALAGAPKPWLKKVPLKAAGILAGFLLLLGTGYFWGYPQYEKWREGKQWYLCLSEEINFSKHLASDEEKMLRKNWNLPINAHVWGGQTRKELVFSASNSVFNVELMNTKEDIPNQPIRIRILSRVTSDNDGFLLLTVPHGLEIKKNPKSKSQASVRPVYLWNGITVLQEYSPNRKRMKLSLGHISKNGSRSDGLLENISFPIGTREYTTEVTYDNDLIQYKGLGNKALELARNLDLDKTGKICFGIGGYNIGVSKIEIYLKKENRDLDMITAADSFRAQGKYDMALKLYDDLIQRVQDNDSKCRFLYRKAMVYLDLKKPDEAMRIYKEIVENYPDNSYTGYARFDLGYLFYKMAGKKGGLKAAGESDRYFRELIQKQPGHSEVPKAKYYLLLNLAENLRNKGQAEEVAQGIIADKANYYRNDALAILFGKIYDAYGKSSPAILRKAMAFLNELSLKTPPLDPLGDDLVITQLKFLRSQKRFDELFDLMLSAVQKAEFSKVIANFVYPLLIDCGKDLRLSPRLDKFYGCLEENKNEAMWIYRNMLSVVGENPHCHAYGFLIRNLSYRKAVPGTKVELVRKVFDSKDKQAGTFTSGPPQKIHFEGEDTAVFNYDTGSYWGCGFNLPVNVGPLITNGAESVVDLRGYDSFEFEAFAPKGLLYLASLIESGYGPVTSDKFPGINGSDGEQYYFYGFVGTGRWKKYHADLADLKPALNVGNQRGNNILDLQAVLAISFAMGGNQGRGQFRVRNVVFTTKTN